MEQSSYRANFRESTSSAILGRLRKLEERVQKLEDELQKQNEEEQNDRTDANENQ